MTIYPATKVWSENEVTDAFNSWYDLYKEFHEIADDTITYTPEKDEALVFDVTQSIKRFVSGEMKNNGFVIHTNSPRAQLEAKKKTWLGGTFTYVYSSECNSVERRPKLIIEYETGTSITNNDIPLNDLLHVKMLNDKLQLQSATLASISYSIYDMRGRSIVSKDMNLQCGNNELNLTEPLSKGFYFISISSKNKTYKRKLCIW